MAAPALYPSVVTHVRTGPRRYALRHHTYLWLVDLDALPRLPRLPRPLRPLARFDARDHLDGRGPTIRAGLARFLAARGVGLDGGRVLMLANARVFGHVFNPLTLYWCFGPGEDGGPRYVVAEVHNTYGERHCYLVRTDEQGRARTEKEFYVSPFFGVDGAYTMRLPVPDARLDVGVRLDGPEGRRLTATVKGTRRRATVPALLRTVARSPWSTAAVSLGIRAHGVRLWLGGLPVRTRPRHRPQEGMK